MQETKKDIDWKEESASEHSSDGPLLKGKKGKVKKKLRGKWNKKPSGWNSSSGGSSDDSEPEDEIEEHEHGKMNLVLM